MPWSTPQEAFLVRVTKARPQERETRLPECGWLWLRQNMARGCIDPRPVESDSVLPEPCNRERQNPINVFAGANPA